MNDPINFRVHRFRPERLDPICVYVEEYKPGSSRMTVQCYARAWTAYWGSHGSDSSVEQFVARSNPEYVADNLSWGTNGLMNKFQQKHDYAYLVRLVQAIQAHFEHFCERIPHPRH